MTALGLDVGGSWLKVAVLDGDQLQHTERVRLPNAGLIDFVTDVAATALDRHSGSSLGVGLAGLVRHPDGELAWGPHLEGEAVPYRRLLGERFGMPVAVDNDANLAALAEARLGAGEGREPMLLVALGTGIGVGLISAGRVYRGRSFAGESGHMTVDPGGASCACGRRGCWETTVSGSRLDAVAAEIGSGGTSAADLVTRASGGDGRARAALTEAGEWLGRGLVTLVLALDPEIVVIGGAVAAAGDLLLDPARRVLASDLPGATHRPPVPVVPAQFGAHAGAVGAALAGRTVQNGANDW